MDGSLDDRGQRHDRSCRRTALQHRDGVLRQHGFRDGPPALEQPVDREGSGTDVAPVPGDDDRTDGHPRELPALVRACPAGYLADGGSVYGNRGNGQTYGWNADNSAQARDRNASSSPNQAYDTFTHTQKSGNANAVWEIAVANGTYSVRVVAGDALYFDSVYRIAVEGVLTVSGTPTSSNRWVEGTMTVTVSDGRLTLTNGAGASNNKICFVEITPQ